MPKNALYHLFQRLADNAPPLEIILETISPLFDSIYSKVNSPETYFEAARNIYLGASGISKMNLLNYIRLRQV